MGSLTSTDEGLRMMAEAGATAMDHEPFIVFVWEQLVWHDWLLSFYCLILKDDATCNYPWTSVA